MLLNFCFNGSTEKTSYIELAKTRVHVSGRKSIFTLIPEGMVQAGRQTPAPPLAAQRKMADERQLFSAPYKTGSKLDCSKR